MDDDRGGVRQRRHSALGRASAKSGRKTTCAGRIRADAGIVAGAGGRRGRPRCGGRPRSACSPYQAPRRGAVMRGGRARHRGRRCDREGGNLGSGSCAGDLERAVQDKVFLYRPIHHHQNPFHRKPNGRPGRVSNLLACQFQNRNPNDMITTAEATSTRSKSLVPLGMVRALLRSLSRRRARCTLRGASSAGLVPRPRDQGP